MTGCGGDWSGPAEQTWLEASHLWSLTVTLLGTHRACAGCLGPTDCKLETPGHTASCNYLIMSGEAWGEALPLESIRGLSLLVVGSISCCCNFWMPSLTLEKSCSDAVSVSTGRKRLPAPTAFFFFFFTKNWTLFPSLNGPPSLSVNQREKITSGDQGDLSWVSSGCQFAGNLHKPVTIVKVPARSSQPWTESGNHKSWAHTLFSDKLIPETHSFPELISAPYLAIC